MIIGQTYVDALDVTRNVVPFSERGDCRVYFDGRYVGKTNVPPTLFNDVQPTTYGFFPFVPPEDTSPDTGDDEAFYDQDEWDDR